MRINLIFNSLLSGVSFISLGKLYLRHFFGKFVFNFECVYTCKFPCIVIVDMCVRSYVAILQINWQTTFTKFKVEFQLLYFRL